MPLPGIKFLLYYTYRYSYILCFCNIIFPTKVDQQLSGGLLGTKMCDIRYNGPYLKPHYSTLLINTKKKKRKMSIWKTSFLQGTNPAQMLMVKGPTCESAPQSRDTPKSCTFACSENRLMESLNNNLVTQCLFVIVYRCSLACYYLYYHSDWKSQAT